MCIVCKLFLNKAILKKKTGISGKRQPKMVDLYLILFQSESIWSFLLFSTLRLFQSCHSLFTACGQKEDPLHEGGARSASSGGTPRSYWCLIHGDWPSAACWIMEGCLKESRRTENSENGDTDFPSPPSEFPLIFLNGSAWPGLRPNQTVRLGFGQSK